MKKIPTIFKRNPENMRELLDQPHPDCLWVFNGEGIATRKHDGTCVKIENRGYFKRREIKPEKSIPQNFIQENLDSNTGKRVGWVPVSKEANEDKYHREVFVYSLPNGTYELCGPKIQGNPEKFDKHILVAHNKAEQYKDVPRTMQGIKQWLVGKDIEGIVFHCQDGRMGKIKKRDFGMKRK